MNYEPFKDIKNALLAEAARFHGLSQSLAASAYIGRDDSERTARLVRDHEVRSETFKAAAALIPE